MVQEDEDASLAKGGKNALSPSFSSDEMLLPLEIRGHIFSFLTKQADLLRAGAVSKHWREAAEHAWATRTLTLPRAVKEQDYATLAGGIFARVSLRNKGLGAKDVDALLKAFQGNITLKELNLGDNSIGDSGTAAIASSLTALTSLDLGSNSIGASGTAAIASSLTALTSLNLEFNSIGDRGVQAIASSLTALTSLNLGSNSIGDRGVQAIASSLAPLTSLNLRWNSIGDSGTAAIASSLTALTSLNLWWNSIGDSGTAAIASSLTALTSLNLGSNSIGEEGTKALEDLKRRKPSLKLNY
jgi:hypothetical protein